MVKEKKQIQKNNLDLKKVINIIQKKFGEEVIAGNHNVEKISSGILSLDIALGGGYPKGRIIEICGWESSGKSTLAFHLAKIIQKSGKAVGYIDMEHAVDPEYLTRIGVSLDENQWILSQPSCGEEGIEIAREMARHEEFGLVVIDSVSALVPRAVLAGEAGDSKMGLLARLMSSMLPTLISNAKKSGCIILFINQFREKIGIMFGNPVTTSGGNALKFYASQRLEVTRFGSNKNDEGDALSNKTRVKIIKNKVSTPFKKTEFNIVFGMGVDLISDIIDVAIKMDLIQKAGSWFSYGDVKLGQGINSVKKIINDNPELLEEIKEKINKYLKNEATNIKD